MAPVRSGAALILALVLLTAILLLGLPFIFSQSASLSGTRSFAAQRLAVAGRESVQNFATALAAYGMTTAMQSTTGAVVPPQWTSLTAAFGIQQIPGPGNVPVSSTQVISSYYQATVQGLTSPGALQGDGSLGVHATGLGLNGQTSTGAINTYVGATITDESGKFDPNTMGPAAWQALLSAVQIRDWPDNTVYPSLTPGTSGYNPSADTYGELAKALANVRYSLPNLRISTLEQLLLANPQFREIQQPYRNRSPLTRNELQALRPYLSLHNSPGGRQGVQDLGTVLANDTTTSGATTFWTTYWLDSMPDPFELLLAGGSAIDSEQPTSLSAHGLGLVTLIPQYLPSNTFTATLWGDYLTATAGMPLANAGQAVMLEAVPVMNVHQLSPVVRTAMATAAHLPVTLPAASYTMSLPLWEQPPVAAALPRPMAANPAEGSIPIESPVTDIGGLWSVLGESSTTPPVLSSPYNLSPFLSPTVTGNALPVLGICSSGVFSIDAACTITDALNRQVAQDHRRTIVQAVPQEYLLERRWRTQGDLYALTAQHWGSRVQSWPVGLERLMSDPNSLPDDQDLSIAGAGTPSTLTSIRPRQMPDFSSAPATQAAALSSTYNQNPQRQQPLEQIYIDWQVGFGLDTPRTTTTFCSSTSLLGSGATATAPAVESVSGATGSGSSQVLPLSVIRPDGFYHAPTTDLEYSLMSNLITAPQVSALFVPHVPLATPTSSATNVPPPTDIEGRHISLWIKPEVNWSGGIFPILEAAMPAANAGLRSDGVTTGAPADENYFGLFYDDTNQLVVLAIAPPTIEHPTDFPLVADPHDNANTAVDPLCRSDAGSLSLAPGEVMDAGAGLTGLTAVYRPNRVLHCYKTPPRASKPTYFEAGRWIHLQIDMASDRPDGVVILVDGIVGQDAAVTANHALTKMGDHATLPSAYLENPLPYLPPSLPVDYTPFTVASLPLATVNGMSLGSMLPSRGMIRIDDEYIRYEGISGNTLTNCTRGWRQDTLTSVTPQTVPINDTGEALPATQTHRTNALVVPGGYHFVCPTLAGGSHVPMLYRGGCTLAQAVGGSAMPAPVAVEDGTAAWNGSAYVLSNADFDTAQFPSDGVVLFGNVFYFFTNGGSSLLLTPVTSAQNFLPNVALGQITPPSPSALPYVHMSTTLTLVSIAVGTKDPTQLGRYSYGPTNDGGQEMIALQDATGRVEWVGYDYIAVNPALNSTASPHAYFVNYSGFPLPGSPLAARGLCRTDYEAGMTFAATTTLVLPVQTDLNTAGHWLGTGDTVTVIPHQQTDASPHLPVQLVVRYVPSDGFPTAANPVANDVHNDYFSFAEPIPDSCTDLPITGQPPTMPYALRMQNWDILCGPCWSGSDLTPLQPNPSSPTVYPTAAEPRGQLPRLDAWSSNYGVGAGGIDAKIAVAGYVNATSTGSDATIDDLCAGGLTSQASAAVGVDGHDTPGSTLNQIDNGIQVIWSVSGTTATPGTTLSAGDTLTDVVVQATTPIFLFGPNMGLVNIDGEVFAYQRPSANDGAAILASYPTLTAVYPGMVAATAYSQVQSSGYFARLVARNLLADGASPSSHVIGSGTLGDGPELPDQSMHCPLLSAVRLSIGPVRQLADSLTTASSGISAWFGLRDLSEVYAGAIPTPTTSTAPDVPLNAPGAYICAADGSGGEMLGIVGPKQDVSPQVTGTQVSYPDANFNKYVTANWLRGLYNTPSHVGNDWQATDPRPIVIGWWPRYASALPQQSQNPDPAQSLRSRSFPWIGFPMPVLGGFFDVAKRGLLPAPYANLPLAEVSVTADPLFSVEVRALAYNATWTSTTTGQPVMDWSPQIPALPQSQADCTSIFESANDGAQSFTSGGQAQPVDGAEVRVVWRYASSASLSSALVDVAAAGNLAPQVTGASVRCLAPVRVIANETH